MFVYLDSLKKVSLLADGQIGWRLWCGWGVFTRLRIRKHKRTCPTLGTHWTEEPLVSSSNLMAVEIIENLSSETREGGGGHAMKIMMRVIHFDLE